MPVPPAPAPADLHAANDQRTALRLLQVVVFTSSFDRFAVGALLVSISADLQVPLRSAAQAASWYFLAYGLSQPVWGLLSDRLGRVRALRLALALAAVGAVVSAAAPGLVLLVAARALTGACIAAAVPAALIYVGDAVPIGARQRTLTDLNAATAAGITVATALAGVLATVASWRVAFLLPGLACAALVVILGALPEPPRDRLARGGLPAVLRSRWALGVLGLALLEGGALLGLLTYFAPALEGAGYPATTSGAVVGLYGVGLLLVSRVVKRLAGRWRPELFLGTGAAMLAVAYAAVALASARWGISAWTIGAAALLVGAAWAAMHSTMQTWATEVVPQARATMVSLFAGMLFVGSGVATSALAPLAGSRSWPALFWLGAGVVLVFGVAAVLCRRRFGAFAEPLTPLA